MPIRAFVITSGLVLLLSACGGGGGGGGSATSSSDGVYWSEIADLGLQVNDVIPLSRLYSLSAPGSSRSWAEVESGLEAEIDGENRGQGKISISNGNLVAQAVTSSALISLTNTTNLKGLSVFVCNELNVFDVVPSGVGMHLNKANGSQQYNLSRNKGDEFKYAGGTAIKAGVATVFVGAGVCADGSGAPDNTLVGVNNGATHYMLNWLSVPVKTISIAGQTFANGQAVTVSTPGRYTATAEFYNGSSKDFEVTVYNSLSSISSEALATDGSGNALFFTNMRFASKPLVKFTQTADSNYVLDVSPSISYWSDSEHLGINDGFRKLYSWINGSSAMSLPFSIAEVEAEYVTYDKSHYFVAEGESFSFKKYAIYNGRSYDVTNYSQLNPWFDFITDNNGTFIPGSSYGEQVDTDGLLYLSYDEPQREVNPVIEIGPAVPQDQQGRWQYVYSGQKRWLGPYATNTFTTIDENTLRDDKDNSVLIRAGISDIQVSGALDSIVALSAPVVNSSRAKATRSGLSGIGGIDVILQNLESGNTATLTTDSNGDFSGTVEAGDYLVTSSVEISGEIVDLENTLTLEGESADLGIFTLVPQDDYNFKASLQADDLVFFGYNNGQTVRIYAKKLRITNTGRNDISGAMAQITFDNTDSLVRSASVWKDDVELTPVNGYYTVGGIPKKNNLTDNFVELELRFSFYRPATDTDVVISVDVQDIDSRVWNDKVSVPVSSHVPLPIQIRGITATLIAPGRELVKLNPNGDAVSYDLPFVAGNSYEVVFNTTSVSSEAAYSLAAGTTLNSSVLNNVATNTNETGAGDDTSATATVLLNGQSTVAYASNGDLDYYRIEMTAETAPVE